MNDDLMTETQRAALIDTQAWKLLLSYAESGIEDDIDGVLDILDAATYDQIYDKAWAILDELRRDHLNGERP